MRALLLLFVSLAVTAVFVCAADDRTDVSTKKLRNVVDDERTMLIPLDAWELSPFKSLKLHALRIAKRRSSVFKRFQLSDDPFKTLSSPSIALLMKMFSANSKEEMKLSQLLIGHYGDGPMAASLVRAKMDGRGSTKAIATTLLERQLEGYLKSDLTGGNVFDKLDMRIAFFDYSDPKLLALESYIELLNKKKKSGHETIANVLASVMGGEDKLIQSLTMAKVSDPEKAKALEVESSLVEKWTSEVDLNPEILLGRLGMKQSLENLLSWEPVMKYISFYNDKHPDNKFSLLKWLAKDMDEADVAVRLVEAKKIKATESIASSLQVELLESWFASGKSLEEIFELLKLKDVESNVSASPEFEILKLYMNFINEKKPQVTPPDLDSVLRKGLGDGKFAIMLSEAMESASAQEFFLSDAPLKVMFKQWYDSGVTPSSAREKFFSNLDENVLNRVELILGKYERFFTFYATGKRRVRFES